MIEIPHGFWRKMCRHHYELTTYLVIADWCQDHDDEKQALGWRWLAKQKKFPDSLKFPWQIPYHHRTTHQWTWYASDCPLIDRPTPDWQYSENVLPRKILGSKRSVRFWRRFVTHQTAVQWVLQQLIERKYV